MSVRRLADAQPGAFAFTKAGAAWAKGEIAKYPKGREASAVLPLLLRAQEEAGGWLPEPAIRHVADRLNMPPIRALEIATFYTMFNLKPVGKHLVQICRTTPCWLRESDALVSVCRRRIGEAGTLSPDGLMSWTQVECLGACVNAPVVQVGDAYYEDLTSEALDGILDALVAGKTPSPGPQSERRASEPARKNEPQGRG